MSKESPKVKGWLERRLGGWACPWSLGFGQWSFKTGAGRISTFNQLQVGLFEGGEVLVAVEGGFDGLAGV